jgi:hypothetical protein
LKALAANEAVGILIDQNASVDAGVFVDFSAFLPVPGRALRAPGAQRRDGDSGIRAVVGRGGALRAAVLAAA